MTQQEQVIDALVRARGLVERGWCQGLHATDSDGRPVFWRDHRAERYCAIGAIYTTPDPRVRMRCVVHLRKAIGGEGDVSGWNDAPERTQADVLALYDRAIALAREATP